MTRLKTCSNDTAPINHYRATAENDRVVRLPWQPIFAYVPATRARYASIFSSSLALSLSLSHSLSESLSAFGGCGRPVRICRAPAKLSAPIDFHLIHCASFGAD